jgi:hypothetical protein
MPTYEGSKSRRVAAGEVVCQQAPVGKACRVPHEHRPAKMLDNLAYLACRHLASLALAIAVVGSVGVYPYYYRQQPL